LEGGSDTVLSLDNVSGWISQFTTMILQNRINASQYGSYNWSKKKKENSKQPIIDTCSNVVTSEENPLTSSITKKQKPASSNAIENEEPVGLVIPYLAGCINQASYSIDHWSNAS
jgi:hypothetical protein